MTELQMRCFLELGKQLNFTQAAKNLEISQSTLSAHIKALEKNLGFSLFLRDKRNVMLSPEGEVILKTFQDAHSMIESGIEVARSLHKNHSSMIRIGYLEGTLINILARELLEDFESSHAETEINLVRMNHNELSRNLNEYNLDVIFAREYLAKGREEWDMVKLFKSPLSILYAKKYEAAITSLEDFEEMTWICVSPEADRLEDTLYKQFSEKYGFIPSKVKFVNSIEAALLNVEMGRGCFLSDHACRAYGTERFCFYDLGVDVNYCCITRKNHPNPEILELQRLAQKIYYAHQE